MTSHLYWWRPTRPLRSFAAETRSHARAWLHMMLGGGGMTNFGDEFSPLAVSEITGTSWSWSPLPQSDLVAVGSILNGALQLPQLPVVLGSGLRGDHGVSPVADHAPFLLVRGALTRDALKLPHETLLGDPGVLAREIFEVPLARRRTQGPVFIPHFAMLQWSTGRAVVSALRAAGWKIVLPNQSPNSMATAIAEASAVLTTSLHGMVFAHSFGTPVSLMEWDAPRVEPRFKYEDYISVFEASLAFTSVEAALARGSREIVDTAEETTAKVAAGIDDVISSVYRAGHSLA